MIRLGPRKLSKALYQCLERSRLVSRKAAQQLDSTIEAPALLSEPLPIRGLSTGTPRRLTPVSIASTTETPQEESVSPVINNSILCVDDNPLNLKVSRREHSALNGFHSHGIASYDFHQEQRT